MGFMDRAKAAAEQAATKAREGAEQATTKAREGVDVVQAKRELTQAYGELGHKAYELSQSGAITSAELRPIVQRISELEAQTGGAESGGDASAGAETAGGAGTGSAAGGVSGATAADAPGAPPTSIATEEVPQSPS